MSKIITVLGGNGYIGSRCISTLLQRNNNIKTIYAISRLGEIKYPVNKFGSQVKIIKGDCLDPSSFKNIIEESTGFIHAIGVLLAPKTETYNKINKKTALNVAQIAEERNKNNPNFVYISASRGLPWPLSIKYPGYIASKRECEEKLLHDFNNINSIILRPGFVKSKEKIWTIPLYYGVNMAEKIERNILNKNIGEKFQLPSSGIDLDVLANFACAAALGLLQGEKIISNDYMNNEDNYKKIKLV